MKIPLYILGLLLRFGPQHGYQIKKIITEQLSDFTQIKLPTIYYHLEKMARDGLLSGSTEKDSNRPEKIIYSITDLGKETFQQFLNEMLQFHYRPEFPSDAIFYFSDAINPALIIENLQKYIENMRNILIKITKHQTEDLSFLPEDAQKIAFIIFNHHEHHYQAELNWALETLAQLELHSSK